MPRGVRKILFSVFDARPISVLEILAERRRSFIEIQKETKLPKATLHRALRNLLVGRMVRKVGNLYAITTDGESVLALCKRLKTRSTLKITDEGVRRVLAQAKRTSRMEKSGFSRIEQFTSIQEAIESVEVIEVPT